MRLPKRVEDFTRGHCDHLIWIIDQSHRLLFNEMIPIKGYYVVGSYCFNVDQPDDLDLVIVIPESFQNINRITGEGYWLVNGFARVSAELSQCEGFKINIHVTNNFSSKNQVEKSGFKIPYYNLVAMKLWGKSPGDIIPYHFHYNRKERGWMAFNRDKRTRVNGHLSCKNI